MGKASRTKRDGSARERIAAQRAAARRTEIRNRVFLASGAVVVVIAIVVAFVLVKANSNAKSNSGSTSNGPTGTALTAVVNKTISVPASVLDSVGAGSVTAGPTAVTGPPLTQGGKPQVLYIGAEYCPYCAAQRWAMIVALSRFGTFSGLTTVHSASRDVYPNTPTFTFHGSHYTSKYVTFAPVEETTNVPNGASSYTPLDKPTAAQQALASKYDSQGSIPFIDFGNKYVEVGDLPAAARKTCPARAGTRSRPRFPIRPAPSPRPWTGPPTTRPRPSASSPTTSRRARVPQRSRPWRRSSDGRPEAGARKRRVGPRPGCRGQARQRRDQQERRNDQERRDDQERRLGSRARAVRPGPAVPTPAGLRPRPLRPGQASPRRPGRPGTARGPGNWPSRGPVPRRSRSVRRSGCSSPRSCSRSPVSACRST